MKRSGAVLVRRRRSSASYSPYTPGFVRLYIRSLLNPSIAGAKIPDSYASRTCTVQLQREFTVTPGVLAGTHYAGVLLQASVNPAYVQHHPTLVQWLPAANYQFVEGPAVGAVGTGQLKVPMLMRTARVVSAGLKVQFVGNTQNDQGTLTTFIVDRSHIAAGGQVTGGTIGNPDLMILGNTVPSVGIDGNTSSLRSIPNSAYGPVRLGGAARYFPSDDGDLEFSPCVEISAGAPSALAADTARAGTVAVMGFWAEGVSNTASFLVQITVNLECTVKDDSINLLSTSPSPVDFQCYPAAMRAVGSRPQAMVGVAGGDIPSINEMSK